MASKGIPLSPADINKIVVLLGDTEMGFGQIAERMRCSRSSIAAINRRFQVREYAGLRTSWKTRAAVAVAA